MQLTALLLTAALTVMPAPATKFKNCDALRAKYPAGVAGTAKAAGTSGAKVNANVYAANKGLDRDKDGIACER